jgi:predicted dehydrogenase
MVNYLQIGIGFMGSNHTAVRNGVRKHGKYKGCIWSPADAKQPGHGLDDAVVLALCDTNEARLRGDLTGVVGNIGDPLTGIDVTGMHTYRDWCEAILDPDVQAVDITLPTDLHAEVFCAALEAGKHVFVEKPLARSLEEGLRMVQAAERAADRGHIAMVGLCIDMWSEYMKLAEARKSGEYGDLLSLQYRRRSQTPTWSSAGWLMDTARSGAALLDFHIHDSRNVITVVGMPYAVRAYGANAGCSTDGGIDWVSTEYIFKGDGKQTPTVHAHGSWNHGKGFPFEMSFIAAFEKGLLELSSEGLIYTPNGGQPQAIKCDPGFPTGWHRELYLFNKAVIDGKQPGIGTIKDGYDACRLVSAEAKSIAQKGRLVVVE